MQVHPTPAGFAQWNLEADTQLCGQAEWRPKKTALDSGSPFLKWVADDGSVSRDPQGKANGSKNHVADANNAIRKLRCSCSTSPMEVIRWNVHLRPFTRQNTRSPGENPDPNVSRACWKAVNVEWREISPVISPALWPTVQLWCYFSPLSRTSTYFPIW